MIIKSLSEFIVTVNKISNRLSSMSSTTLPWYRGQADESWHLTPSIYRGNWEPEFEREINRDFKLRSLLKVEKKPEVDVEWLFVMQHHGIPTRLLDWTEGYLIALYFAVEEFENTSNGAVWVLHPWKLNIHKDTLGYQSVPILNEEINDNFKYPYDLNDPKKVKKPFPIAIRPDHSTQRIQAQRGQFTIHGSKSDSLDQLDTQLNLGIEKILIGGTSKRSILGELYSAGINRSTLFPDVDGLAKEISIRYSKKFMK